MKEKVSHGYFDITCSLSSVIAFKNQRKPAELSEPFNLHTGTTCSNFLVIVTLSWTHQYKFSQSSFSSSFHDEQIHPALQMLPRDQQATLECITERSSKSCFILLTLYKF